VPKRDAATTQSNGLGRPEFPTDGSAWAAFLDVDGTLVEFADTPDEVRVPEGLVELLGELEAGLDGALALVSGRPLRQIDQLFAPAVFAAAGVHGAELRVGTGDVRKITVDPTLLDPAREAFLRFAEQHAGTIVEDKQYAIALHYRRRLDVVDEVRRLAGALAADLGVDFHLLEGKMVVEVRVSAAHKGAALEAFLQDEPFAGRTPVYIGDDVTDEDAFRTVNARGGVSVIVGDHRPTAAAFRLATVSAVHQWLRDAAAHVAHNG
jgi:trehalose 6-phosphate phosphatase